jgi:Cu(I)/Ag(I) efflux system membrane fusion protein
VKALLKYKDMNKLHNFTISIKAIWILSFTLLLITALSACKQRPKEQQAQQVANRFYYTCSMHPQIHEDHPGDCPICGMKLIKAELTGSKGSAQAEKISLTAVQIQLAGIRTDTIIEQNTGAEKTLTGTVNINENTAEELSARISGRIQRLFVRATGEKITAGQPVYSIYSEDLLQAQSEYLLARQQQKVLNNPDVDYQGLISSAENKLRLWGLSAAQIRNLASSGKPSATKNILSSVNGTVTEIAVHEGDYVAEGSSILKTQSLNSLWVEAQIYTSETGNYKVGDLVSVSFPDLGPESIGGKVEFINPELSDASKVTLIRISVPNSQGLIRPGMLAYISLASGKGRSLAVPASAVLTGGKGSKVWVKNTDGSFSPRTITVGDGNLSYVSVTSGLKTGDVVVTGGAYLLNSELILKNGSAM